MSRKGNVWLRLSRRRSTVHTRTISHPRFPPARAEARDAPRPSPAPSRNGVALRRDGGRVRAGAAAMLGAADRAEGWSLWKRMPDSARGIAQPISPRTGGRRRPTLGAGGRPRAPGARAVPGGRCVPRRFRAVPGGRCVRPFADRGSVIPRRAVPAPRAPRMRGNGGDTGRTVRVRPCPGAAPDRSGAASPAAPV